MLGPEYELVFTSVAHFGKEMIDAQPLEARELGCDPDYNAWTGKVNPVPDVETPFRTGAGHIHIGWTQGQNPKNEAHLQVCRHLIRNLDYVTMPTTLVDTDVTRRKLYGAAGAFRPKSYGVEYRTPSNFWLASDELMGWMYDLIVNGIRTLATDAQPEVKVDTVHRSYAAKCIRGTFLDNNYRYSKEYLLGVNEKFGGKYNV
jgi:hypothetical protein